MRKTLVLTALILAVTGGIGTKSAQAGITETQITEAQRKVYTKNLKQSENTIRWFNSKKHNWRLHKRFKTCYGVKVRYSSKRAGICYLSRLSYRKHTERIKRLRAILYPLPPNYSAWICINSYEAGPEFGGWAANTGNGFYGGLQMNMAFQRAYGPELLARKGTANNWTMLEQMWVAERALQARGGFNPWPNTGRYCGLPMFF